MLKKSVQALVLLAGIATLSAYADETISVDATQDSSGATSSTNAASTSAAEDSKVERVEVTGSHIKRLAVEGVSPVQTVTRKELEKSGYNSLSDVLRDTGDNSFGSQREASGSNAAGVAHVDLHGLGASNTLVLLNGQRLPTDAVTGAVDLNMIPMAAVERVEILKDGASAIYGSDALGGVVNIITKRDFSGTEARVSQSVPSAKGGARTDIGLVTGVNTENLNIVTVGQFRNNDVVYARDRPWSAYSQSLSGGPGSYQDTTGTWHADANCPADRLLTTPQGTFCTYNPSADMTQLPALQQMSVSSEANYQASSKVKVTARAGGTRRLVNWSYAAAPGTFKIPGAVADHLGPGGTPLPGATPGEDLPVRYRLTELGNRDTEVTTYGYNLLLGSSIQVTPDWQVDVTVAHNGVRSSDKGINGYALTKKLNEAIENGTYNPFGPDGSKGSLQDARYVPTENTVSLLSSAEAKVSGPIAEFGNDQISVAFGTTATHQEYADNFDEKSVNNEVFGNAGSSGGGQRRTQALFSELSVPVFDSRAEIQLAGRFDHYSDFGSTTNPRAALLLRPTKDLLLRASVGSGFRAPLMQDLYAATSIGYPTFIDHVACDAEKKAGGDTPACLPQQYAVTSSGNTGLREERSISMNVGAVYEPTKIFNIGADVFAARMKNVVGIDYDDAMLAASQGIDLGRFGVTVKRDAKGYIDEIVAPMQNLSAQHISGIDLSAGFQPVADIRLATEHSQLFHFQEEGFPGMGMRNKLDENGKPRWRNTTSITYNPNDEHDVTLAALTTAGQEKSVKEQGRIPTYTSFDVSYAYKNKDLGTFSLGVKNLLGTTPPLDDSNPNSPLNTDIYDQIGRQFIVGYSKTF